MIKDNVFKIKERISKICSQTNRDQRDIVIVAVAKGRALDNIKEVLAAGITDIGENKVQEAILKYSGLTPLPAARLPDGQGQAGSTYNLAPIKWHMVGHLQTNKVKDAVRIFDLIQSVDSLRLAQAIDKEAGRINKVQEILLEVKTSPEATKFGIDPQQLLRIAAEISVLKNIKINGLMTVAPLAAKPEDARPYFKLLHELYDKLSVLGSRLSVISMGMTDDFEVAIEEGANMLRLGRAIFEC